MKFLKEIFFLLYISLTIIKLTKAEEESEGLLVQEINDSNFESSVNNGLKNPWLVIFYIESCPHCKNAKNALNNLSNNPHRLNKSSIKLSTLDCDKNMFSCYRFKVSRVPYIVIIDSNHMYEMQNYPNEENFANFINSKKNPDDGLEIPDVIGYMTIIAKSFEELVSLMDSFFSKFFLDYFKLKVEWTAAYSIAVLLFTLIFVITLEIVILNFLCRPKKKACKKPENISSNSSVDNQTAGVAQEAEEAKQAEEEPSRSTAQSPENSQSLQEEENKAHKKLKDE